MKELLLNGAKNTLSRQAIKKRRSSRNFLKREKKNIQKHIVSSVTESAKLFVIIAMGLVKWPQFVHIATMERYNAKSVEEQENCYAVSVGELASMSGNVITVQGVAKKDVKFAEGGEK